MGNPLEYIDVYLVMGWCIFMDRLAKSSKLSKPRLLTIFPISYLVMLDG